MLQFSSLGVTLLIFATRSCHVAQIREFLREEADLCKCFQMSHGFRRISQICVESIANIICFLHHFEKDGLRLHEITFVGNLRRRLATIV